jgi:hypothetical protein
MTHFDTEAAENAAYRMERAARSANEAADRLEEVLRQLRVLTEDGYGNNVSQLVALLQAQENTK